MKSLRAPDQPDTKVCEQCGNEFSKPPHVSWPKWRTTRFCGFDCYRAAVGTPMECPVCGSEFRRRYEGQRTCAKATCRGHYRRTVSGPATSERMKAEYADGRRKRLSGLSKRERAMWPLLAPKGWAWRLRWTEAGGAFELDFAHIGRKLNVEIDGIEHREPRRLAKDGPRDAELERRGWRVLRIPNEEVDASPEVVAKKIAKWARSVG